MEEKLKPQMNADERGLGVPRAFGVITLSAFIPSGLRPSAFLLSFSVSPLEATLAGVQAGRRARTLCYFTQLLRPLEG